jgi:hypothetical protein
MSVVQAGRVHFGKKLTSSIRNKSLAGEKKENKKESGFREKMGHLYWSQERSSSQLRARAAAEYVSASEMVTAACSARDPHQNIEI